MNRFTAYIVAFLAMVMTSCEKVTVEQEEPLLPSGSGIIKFTTGFDSRAPIITDFKEKSFGVVGFSYPEYQNWLSARVLATPTLCHNLTVDCSAEGVCSYDNDNGANGIQPMFWDLVAHHTFFAYYPLTTSVYNSETPQTAPGVYVSSNVNNDTPFILYNLPLSSSSDEPVTVNPDDLMDIMTASSIDQTVRNGVVKLQFHHRLCCIDVVARNFTDVSQDIRDLYVTISGIQFTGIKVPMHKKDTKFRLEPLGSAPGDVTFSVGTMDSDDDDDNVVTVPMNTEKSVSAGQQCIMLVPQDGHLSGDVSFTANGIQRTKHFYSNFALEEGKKYSIVINFTGDDVYVLMVQSGSWEKLDNDIKFEFE